MENMSDILVHTRDVEVITQVSLMEKVEKFNSFVLRCTRAVQETKQLEMIRTNLLSGLALASKFLLTLKWIREQDSPQTTILLSQLDPFRCDEFLLQSVNRHKSFVSASHGGLINLS